MVPQRNTLTALCLLAVFASAAAGQGFHYPDLGYFPLDEGSGSAITNTAVPGTGDPMPPVACCASPSQPYWVTPGAVGLAGLSFHASNGGLGQPIQTGIVPDYSNSFTIEFWLRPETGDASGTILGDLTGGAWQLGVAAPLGQIFWVSSAPLSPSTPWLGIPGRWYHIALVQDGAAMMRSLYIDGLLRGSAFHVPQPHPAAAGLVLGDFVAAPPTPQDLPFSIDDVRVWGSARSADDISIHRRRALVPNAENQLSVGQSGPGIGDFTMSLNNISLGATQGWTLISIDTSRQAGDGPLFGMWPVPGTFQILGQPVVVGSPFHFPILGIPNEWPSQAFVLPAGALNSIAGLSWDFVSLISDDAFTFIGASNLVRVHFE